MYTFKYTFPTADRPTLAPNQSINLDIIIDNFFTASTYYFYCLRYMSINDAISAKNIDIKGTYNVSSSDIRRLRIVICNTSTTNLVIEKFNVSAFFGKTKYLNTIINSIDITSNDFRFN